MWCECQPGFTGQLCGTSKILTLNRNALMTCCFIKEFESFTLLLMHCYTKIKIKKCYTQSHANRGYSIN